MSDDKSLGIRIENLIEKMNISQIELSKRIGMDKSVLNRIISGERRARDNELIALSKELNVSVDYLLGRNVSSSITTEDEAATEIASYFRKVTSEIDVSEDEEKELEEDFKAYMKMRAELLKAKRGGK